MAFKGAPVISTLNHICESDGVKSWTLFCLPHGWWRTVWRGGPLSRSPEIRSSRWVTRFTEEPHALHISYSHILHVHAQNQERRTQTCTRWRAPRTTPALLFTTSAPSARPPFQIEHMVPDSENQTDALTSPAHSARGQTCFLFTSD